MNRLKALSILFALVLLVAPVAWAHPGEDGHEIMGEVTTVHPPHLEIATKDGKAVKIEVPEKAMVMRGQTMIALADLKPGDRVVVTVEREDKEPMVATLGMVGASAPARKKEGGK